jgi:hypothetical protein
VLLERLRNEVTRLPAVRGFHVIASSALKLPLEGVLEPLVVRRGGGGEVQGGVGKEGRGGEGREQVLEPLVVRRGRGRGTDEDAAGCGGC